MRHAAHARQPMTRRLRETLVLAATTVVWVMVTFTWMLLTSHMSYGGGVALMFTGDAFVTILLLRAIRRRLCSWLVIPFGAVLGFTACAAIAFLRVRQHAGPMYGVDMGIALSEAFAMDALVLFAYVTCIVHVYLGIGRKLARAKTAGS